MINVNQLIQNFQHRFGSIPRIFSAPGRVNLIGEHTDYNGGHVLPMALSFQTTAAISARIDRKIRIFTQNKKKLAEFGLDDVKAPEPSWLKYAYGVAKLLEKHGIALSGADILLWSDLPAGAGLSSSAALEIVLGFALSRISRAEVDLLTLAKIGQQTEHEFIGAKVGIMDQFVSAHGRKDHAIFLNCETLGFEHIPLNLGQHSLIIANTMVKHSIAASEYNTRRAECMNALDQMCGILGKKDHLCGFTTDEFNSAATNISEIERKRARHIIFENSRTIESAKALKNGDLGRFGALMFESHKSLKDDFQVSCRELDILVDIAARTKGVIGSRMTGGGFGGSTVSLVETAHAEEFSETLSKEYFAETGLKPTISKVVSDNGVREISK